MGKSKDLSTISRQRLLFALLLTALAATGCGPKVTSRLEESTSSSSVSKLPVTCTNFTSAAISGKVSTYPGGSADGIKIRLLQLISSFDSSSNVKLKFFRWRISSGGFADLDSNPLQLRLESPSTQSHAVGVAISGYATDLNSEYISTIRSQAAQISATNGSDFLRQVDIIAYGLDQSWQALKIVAYDYTGVNESGTAKVLGSIDMLIPSYEANPNIYGQDHAVTLLHLHPFYDYRSQNIDFYTRAAQMCP